MSFVPELTIGWEYAWWFPAVYALITIVVILVYGRAFMKRFLRKHRDV